MAVTQQSAEPRQSIGPARLLAAAGFLVAATITTDELRLLRAGGVV